MQSIASSRMTQCPAEIILAEKCLLHRLDRAVFILYRGYIVYKSNQLYHLYQTNLVEKFGFTAEIFLEMSE